MNRLLIVLTRPMGAVIRALPVLSDIKRQSPDVEIHWLASEACADLLCMHGAVDEVVRLNLPYERRLGLARLIQLRQSLKDLVDQSQFDAVLDLEGTLESAVLCSAFKARRLGPGFLHAAHLFAPFFYSQRAGWDKQAHAVEQYRELSAGLLGTEIQGPPEFYEPRPKTLSAPASHRMVWLIHTASHSGKAWPLQAWRELCHRLTDMGCQVRLPWGSDKDRLQAERIAMGIAGTELLPQMSISELAQGMRQIALVVGLDTGLTHLAAAMHRPVVAIFSTTPVWRYAPRFDRWAISVGDQGRAPSVGETYEAASRLLRGNKV